MARASISSYNKPQSRGRSRGRGRGWYEKAVYVPSANKKVAPVHREVALKGRHSRSRPAPSNSHYSRQLMSRGKIDLSRHKSPTMLMTKEMERKIPPLYSTEEKKPEDVTVHAHYFTPFSSWDWYITEYDGKDTMFGLVKGHEVELGYISLSELKSQGANVERDLYFGETSLAEVMKKTGYRGYIPSKNFVYKVGDKTMVSTEEPLYNQKGQRIDGKKGMITKIKDRKAEIKLDSGGNIEIPLALLRAKSLIE